MDFENETAAVNDIQETQTDIPNRKAYTIIYSLEDGKPGMVREAEYSLPPKQALICFIMQMIHENYDTWTYPEHINGMRESATVPDRWYYTELKARGGRKDCTLAAYPA